MGEDSAAILVHGHWLNSCAAGGADLGHKQALQARPRFQPVG